MFVSIFGGLLFTVIVFGLAKKINLSSFWAAVVAAAIPSFVYAAYALANWPGLDVLTIHLVAYPTVALLLYQMGGSDGQPPAKMHWAPKLVIVFFLLITMVLGGFVYIAGNGVPPTIAQWLLPNIQGKIVHTGFAGVVVHGEEASKSIAYQRNLDAKLNKLGWKVDVFGLRNDRSDTKNDLKVVIRGQDGLPVRNVKVSIGFMHPGQDVQADLPLVAMNDGSYQAKVRLPDTGEWLAVLTLEHEAVRVVVERALNGE